MTDQKDLRLRRRVLQEPVTPEERAMLTAGGTPADIMISRIRKRKRRRIRWWVLGVIGGVGLLLLTLWVLRTFVPESFPPETGGGPTGGETSLRAVALYFAALDGSGLVEEVRYLPDGGGVEADLRATLDALLAGPTIAALSPWPAGATVQDLFISRQGIVYINFGGSLRWLMPRGDFVEWSVVASLTRTLCGGFAEVEGVRILIDGESTGPLRMVMPLDWTYHPAMFAEGEGL